MFNLLKCILEDVAATNSLDNDSIVMNTFDIKNDFNTLQRHHINNQMTAQSQGMLLHPSCLRGFDSQHTLISKSRRLRAALLLFAMFQTQDAQICMELHRELPVAL